MIQDTLQHIPGTAGKAGIADVAETDPGLFMFMMIFLVGIVVSAIVCIILLLIIAMVLFSATVTGIVSASVLIAWYKKSVSAGFQWLVLLTGSVVGGLVAGAGYTLFCLLSVYCFDAVYCLIALLAGVGGGWMAGKVAIILAKRLFHKIIQA